MFLKPVRDNLQEREKIKFQFQDHFQVIVRPEMPTRVVFPRRSEYLGGARRPLARPVLRSGKRPYQDDDERKFSH